MDCSVRFDMMHEGGVYPFPIDEQRQIFLKKPAMCEVK
jgi:hypothetical protein